MKFLMKKIRDKFLSRHSLINPMEFKKLVQRMDSGNFQFNDKEKKKMIKQWHNNNSMVPIPSKLKAIFNSQDAIYINSKDAAELSFKLPYGNAYEQVRKDGYIELIERVSAKISLEKKFIIDAGCGFGGLLTCLHSKFSFSKFMGIECVPEAYECLSQKYPWLNIKIIDIEEDQKSFLEHFSEKADIIFCTEVLEHLQNPKRAIQNLLSIKKTTGALVLSVPNGRVDTAAQHIHFWSPESWKIFLRESAPLSDIQIAKTLISKSYRGYNLCAIITDKVL